MKGRTKYFWSIFLVLVLAVSMVPVITAAPASANGYPPEDLIGAVTGWTWEWCYNTPMDDECEGGYPYNTNSRDSIMLVFEDCWEPYVDPECFRIDYTYRDIRGTERTALNVIPETAEYHCWYEGENYGLVFLTLPPNAKPMATDATPTIRILDGAGEIVDELIGGIDPVVDGIAPMLSIEVEGDPHAGGLVEVTVTASEPLYEAYLLNDCDGGLPTIDWFPVYIESPDNYGGYCGGPYFGGCWWSPDDWLEDNVVAYWNFYMEAADPQDTFYVEVLAHDYTYCDGPWWMHEKWNTESVFIQGKDTLVLHLWEGWNLISFPRTPVDPTLASVFGDCGVNKIYTFKNSRWYGSAYNIQTGQWATPRGLRGLSTVEPGVGYWVYCSPLGNEPDSEWYWEYLTGLMSEKLGLEVYANTVWNDLIVELEPAAAALAVPPSYRLQRGWNLVGVPVMGSLDLMQIEYWGGMPTLTHVPMTKVSDFLSGVEWSSLFWYLPTLTADWEWGPGMTLIWPAGYHGTTPTNCDELDWKVGFWMSAFSNFGVPLGLEEPVDLAGYEDYRGEFITDLDGGPCDFMSYFEGYTEYGDYFEGELCGEIDYYMGTTTGAVYGTICRDEYWDGMEWVCDYEEDFTGTFTGWFDPDISPGIPVGGSFTGTTDRGNVMKGTYGGNRGPGGLLPDFVGSVQGTIYPADAGLMETTVPVVMPGYGYWVYANEAGVLVPVR